MGVPIAGLTYVYDDNMSVIHNTQRPESTSGEGRCRAACAQNQWGLSSRGGMLTRTNFPKNILWRPRRAWRASTMTMSGWLARAGYRDTMPQSTKQWCGLDCKGNEDSEGPSITKGGDGSWGRRHWTGEGETVRQRQGMKRHRRGSGYLYIYICISALRERKDARNNAVCSQGGGISMVHRCRLRPAGCEESLRYL